MAMGLCMELDLMVVPWDPTIPFISSQIATFATQIR